MLFVQYRVRDENRSLVSALVHHERHRLSLHAQNLEPLRVSDDRQTSTRVRRRSRPPRQQSARARHLAGATFSSPTAGSAVVDSLLMKVPST